MANNTGTGRIGTQRLPQPPTDDKFLRQWAAELVRVIQYQHDTESAQISDTHYSLSNTTTTHTLDVSTATLTQVANLLCTLIAEMQAKGLLK